MAQTANLGLPLIDANMTADVPRDMNALAEAVDTAVTEAVEGVTVPDATTTQKGVVQLNDTTTSTNKTQAGTADAVRRAYERGSEGVTAAAAAQAKADAAETPAGAQAKANAAEANAKNYAKSYADTEFYNRGQHSVGNILKNSSGILEFNNWTKVSGNWNVWGGNARSVSFFALEEARTSGSFAVLDSDPIFVFQNSTYTAEVDFHTSGITATGAVFMQVIDARNDNALLTITATPNTGWHRKSGTVLIPSGVTDIKIRLVATNKPAATTAGFTRISLKEINANGTPYTLEGDIAALFQSVANGKQAIATAISDKGVPASGSDEFAVLANKVSQINTGKKYFYQTYSGETTVNVNVGFEWRVVYVVSSASAGGFNIYVKNPVYGTYETRPGGSYSPQLSQATNTGFTMGIFSGGGTYHVMAYQV